MINQEILVNQTELIEELLRVGILDYEDITNGYDGDDEPVEIFEWWVITDWLNRRLEAFGEPILATDFGRWWGRTATGQSITVDTVIKEIHATYCQ
jgi:hypothetical protein